MTLRNNLVDVVLLKKNIKNKYYNNFLTYKERK